jgi:hypothetical protein
MFLAICLTISGVGRLYISRYGHSDLVLPDRFWIISHGSDKQVYPCNIRLGYYVLDNGDLFSRLLGDFNQVVRLFFLS